MKRGEKRTERSRKRRGRKGGRRRRQEGEGKKREGKWWKRGEEKKMRKKRGVARFLKNLVKHMHCGAH